MEKRFVLFIVLASAIMLSHLIVTRMLFPPDPAAEQLVEADGAPDGVPLADGEVEQAQNDQQDADADQDRSPAPPDTAGDEDAPPSAALPDAAAEPDPAAPLGAAGLPSQWVALGSAKAKTPYRLAAVFCNQGAALERVLLVERKKNGMLRYRDLTDRSGFLGPLALAKQPEGVRVNVVLPGSPAATARANTPGTGPGLQVGDILVRVDQQPISTPADLEAALRSTKPGKSIEVQVQRQVAGRNETLVYTAELEQRPIELVGPEDASPLSLAVSLHQLGEQTRETNPDELDKLAELLASNWEMQLSPDKPDQVAFRYVLDLADLELLGGQGALELTKTFRLARSKRLEVAENPLAYHLEMDIQIKNLGSTAETVAYQLDGPNGLPLEGWWYSNKIHPKQFAAAGARDVAWFIDEEGDNRLATATQLQKQAVKEPSYPATDLFEATDPKKMYFAGVDTKYFAAMLMPKLDDDRARLDFASAKALPLGNYEDLQGRYLQTANPSVELISRPQELAPNESLQHSFVLFAGPKRPELLEEYGLVELVEHGWAAFSFFARILAMILHVIYGFVGNYGIAIIILTLIVRSFMFPLSKKAAQNAAMMQELAPEMKQIAEKYKNDLQKRGEAQRELFAKHNYNPMGGCMLMFLQLPVFIGLYKALSVDIELRQSALLPGIHWCSNLAGPDQLVRWDSWMPAFFSDPGNGWLGPYFNILPVITVCLFLLQQKMFTPPPTDEQTRMQHQMMKYMMVFMGVMFFKVPSGLCIYFITSSLWGICERKLLKRQTGPAAETETKQEPAAKPVKNKGGKRSKPSDKPAAKTWVEKLTENAKQISDNINAKTQSNGSTQRNRSRRRPKKK